MPDFSVEMWQNFKQQFLSVIDWLLYSFDILYDSFRSKPMLYLFVFFPIFALMFFAVFNLLTRLVPIKALFDSSDTKNDNSMLKSSLRAGARNSGSQAVNLASAQNRQSRGSAQGLHVSPPKANPFNSPGASHAQAHGSGGFNRAGSPGSVRAVVAGGSPSGSSSGIAHGTSAGSNLGGANSDWMNGQQAGLGHAAVASVRDTIKGVKKKKDQKAAEEEKRAKEAAKAEAEAQKAAEKEAREQLAYDKAFNYEDRLEMGRDFETGDTFVKKTTYNTRTGEEVGYHVTTKHYLGKNDSEESN